ncbi:DUF4179 domain-containing protein [Ruminiclostridium papyrosolvens]|uniref:DUF4179 domain-containing protein n=1 Tax=Ruminiclostridium papyrosolvens C7 TaxID=1330534 RepID=U4QWZ3_9FIRM|nr:DUF4179 domain-containing protein [Ruminiclostridium papyrosolvens]EPR08071.1 hypothetical protein L323_18190 [Ruminiclostridium papyrosolvens C7]
MQKNSFDNIYLPERLEAVANSAIKRGQKTFLLRHFITITISTLVLLMGLFGTCYASPSVAKTLSRVPFVGSVFLQFTDEGLKTVSKEGLTNFTGMEVTKQNGTVSINEIYYDKSGISFGLALKGVNPYTSSLQYLLYYKDKLISGSLNGGIKDEPKGVYLISLKTSVPNDLPDTFNLKLIVKESTGLKREFEFHVPVSRARSDLNTKEYPIMKSFESDNKKVFIRKISFTPAALCIDFDYTKPNDDNEFSLKLLDEKGKRIQLNSLTGTEQINENGVTSKSNSYHAVFNPVTNVPDKLRLDIIDTLEEKTIFSTEFEVITGNP